jgi:hypothetical protein
MRSVGLQSTQGKEKEGKKERMGLDFFSNEIRLEPYIILKLTPVISGF